MNPDKERQLEIFGYDLMCDLLTTFELNAHLKPSPAQENEVSDFTQEDSKAALFSWVYFRNICRPFINYEYPVFITSSKAFFSFVANYSFKMYLGITPATGIYYVAGFVLEVMRFLAEHGVFSFICYAPLCWAEVYRWQFGDEFFKAGGWIGRRNKVESLARKYNIYVHSFIQTDDEKNVDLKILKSLNLFYKIIYTPLERAQKSLCEARRADTSIKIIEQLVKEIPDQANCSVKRAMVLQKCFGMCPESLLSGEKGYIENSNENDEIVITLISLKVIDEEYIKNIKSRSIEEIAELVLKKRSLLELSDKIPF